jgi:hypothetical protein
MRDHRGAEQRLHPPGEHGGDGWGGDVRDHRERGEQTPFQLEHHLVSRTLELVRHDNGDEFYFTVAASGSFAVMYPGMLQRGVAARVRHSYRVDTPEETLPEERHKSL